MTDRFAGLEHIAWLLWVVSVTWVATEGVQWWQEHLMAPDWHCMRLPTSSAQHVAISQPSMSDWGVAKASVTRVRATGPSSGTETGALQSQMQACVWRVCVFMRDDDGSRRMARRG